MSSVDRDEPYYTVTRVGRWLHEVNLVMPLPDCWASVTYSNSWYAFGRRRAEILGARKLRRHLLREAWKAADHG